MRFGAILNQMEQDMKDRKYTGRVFVALDVRDGGIGNITMYDVAKVARGSTVFMTDNGSYVLREICIK